MTSWLLPLLLTAAYTGAALSGAPPNGIIDPDAPPNVIIDCDPAGMILTGLDVDDDLAIITAVNLNASGELRLLGLTTTAGNAPLEQVHADALELRNRLGLSAEQLPIHAGAQWWWPLPYQRDAEYMETNASRFIVETVMSAPPRTVNILCLGPLANIVAALQFEPELGSRLKSLVIMGGTMERGGHLDFNFRFDRPAAAAVLNAPVPKVLVPVQTAIQAGFGHLQFRQLQSECCVEIAPMHMPTACSLSTRLWLQAWIMSWLVNWRWVASATAIAAAERHGDDNADGLHPKLSAHLNDGFVLWDVVALFVLARPELFSDWSRHEVRLFNESELARNAALFAKQQSQVRRQQLTKSQQRQRGAAKYADAEEGPEVGDDAGTDTTLGLLGELEVSAEIDFAGEVDYGDSFWRTEHERTQERGRVTVPRTLSSEAALLAEFHGHLCTPQAAAAVAALPPSLLSWWVVLGVLPHLVFLAAAGFGGAYWLLIQDGGGKFGALFGVGNGNHAGDLGDFRDRDRDRERAAGTAQWGEPAVGRKARPPEREGFEEQDDKEEGKGASEAEEKRQATPVASSANSLVAGLDLVEQVAVEEEQMAVDAAAITTATTEAETEEDEEEETEEDLLQRRRLWIAGRERRLQRAISEMAALTHTASTNKAELSRVLRK